VPDADDLLLHMRWEDAFTGKEPDWADDSLQRATDLMQVATGLEEDPEDELALRLMTTGILAQAHAIFITGGPDREALYSPYSSERLGSYSYSKAQQAVVAGLPTGVPEFDFAVNYLTQGDEDNPGPISASAEHVWRQPIADYEEDLGGFPHRDEVLLPDAWGN
jgi:hypothetical protein